MSKQVPEESSVSTGRLCPVSIRDSRCLDDLRVQVVLRHVVNQAYKSMVQDIFLHCVSNLSSPQIFNQVIDVSVVPLEILHKPLVVLEDFTLWFI